MMEKRQVTILKSVEVKYVREFESWIWYVNDVLIYESKNRIVSEYFELTMKSIVGQGINDIALSDGWIEKQSKEEYEGIYTSLSVNGRSVAVMFSGPTKLARVGKRLEDLFGITVIDRCGKV